MGDLLEAALSHLTDAGLVTAAEGADAELRLSRDGETRSYVFELKNRMSPALVRTVQAPAGRQLFVVASHISDAVGDLLRSRDIHYADTVGNMYVRWPGMLLDVRGRRGPTVPGPGSLGRAARAFKPSGLKVVFALLADPELIGKTYREIAEAASVSLGTIQWVLKELESAGYVTTAPRRLYRTGHLLDRWAEGYTFELWPRLTLARFDAPDPGWWTGADEALRAAGALWGGETAVPRIRPERAVVYARSVPQRLALDYRFRKAEGEGNMEIRELFWRLPGDSSLTVPAHLVYADLIASGDPRLAEAAADLRENDALLRRLDRG